MTQMRLLKIIFILFALLIGISTKARDSVRINTYPRYIHMYAHLGPSINEFEIKHPDVSNNLKFKPNVGSEFNLGFYYSWFGLELSLASSADDPQLLKKGNTTRFDMEGHYTMKRVLVDLTVKKYKGYYIANPQDFITDWNGQEQFPIIPDLTSSKISGSFTYVFSPDRFSPKAAYRFTQSMRNSGGSWLLGSFASRSRITTDSSIVPSAIKDYIDLQYDLRRIAFTDLGISIGYAYLQTLAKKIFLSATLQPGLSFQLIDQQSSLDGSIRHRNTLSLRSIVRISGGFNGDRFYGGLAAYQESSIVKNNDAELSVNSGHLYFFVGYRINTDNWHFMKKVDQLLHPKPLKFITGTPPDRN